MRKPFYAFCNSKNLKSLINVKGHIFISILATDDTDCNYNLKEEKHHQHNNSNIIINNNLNNNNNIVIKSGNHHHLKLYFRDRLQIIIPHLESVNIQLVVF